MLRPLVAEGARRLQLDPDRWSDGDAGVHQVEDVEHPVRNVERGDHRRVLRRKAGKVPDEAVGLPRVVTAGARERADEQDGDAAEEIHEGKAYRIEARRTSAPPCALTETGGPARDDQREVRRKA